jgi:hypothetical protein
LWLKDHLAIYGVRNAVLAPGYRSSNGSMPVPTEPQDCRESERRQQEKQYDMNSSPNNSGRLSATDHRRTRCLTRIGGCR